jgi:cathepsin L
MLILALLVLLVTANVSEQQVQFKSWASQFNKLYQSEEEAAYRFTVYQDNAKFVAEHDAEARGFKVALNEFADLTNAEFRALYNGMNLTKTPADFFELSINTNIPETVDWRKQGAVTGVKNQGQCGSCWSFSATGSTEGAHFIKNKKLVSLSEQNLIDCSTRYGNMGCNGGLMDSAFKYIIANHGIDTEASYPYTATGPNACRFNAAHIGATLASYHDVASGNEAKLAESVAEGPTSVAIDASHRSFQLYHSGVYNEPACSSTQLDHGVLAVGYGVEGGHKYWLVKNSWGPSWGLSGYILMSRDSRNQCGIATAASRPVA